LRTPQTKQRLLEWIQFPRTAASSPESHKTTHPVQWRRRDDYGIFSSEKINTGRSSAQMMTEHTEKTTEELKGENDTMAPVVNKNNKNDDNSMFQPKNKNNNQLVNDDSDDNEAKEAPWKETENGNCHSSVTNDEEELPKISFLSLNDVNDCPLSQTVDVVEQQQQQQQGRSTPSPESPRHRALSLSSTPDRSLSSSTSERLSSRSSTPETARTERPDLPLVKDDDTWIYITKRDRKLSNANAIAVMDHAHTVLEKRICEASDQFNVKENLNVFEKTLGRFQNSEIKLGKR
jgi:hypothetical protein